MWNLQNSGQRDGHRVVSVGTSQGLCWGRDGLPSSVLHVKKTRDRAGAERMGQAGEQGLCWKGPDTCSQHSQGQSLSRAQEVLLEP